MSYSLPKLDKVPAHKENALSDELHDKIQDLLESRELGAHNTVWIHLRDGVSRGTITPGEAYDSIACGHVNPFLCSRKSAYSHLI